MVKKSKIQKESIFNNPPEKPETFKKLKREGGRYLLSWFDFFAHSLRDEIIRKPREFLLLFISAMLISVVITAIAINAVVGGINFKLTTPSFVIPGFGGAEISTGRNNLVKFDPMALVEKIKKADDDYVLVDIRSGREYENGHIKTAISIPIGTKGFIKPNGSLDRGLIRKTINQKASKKSEIIIYSDSQYTSYPEIVAQILGNKAKVLAIGWNEWANFKNLWVPESSWDNINIDDFVQRKE